MWLTGCGPGFAIKLNWGWRYGMSTYNEPSGSENVEVIRVFLVDDHAIVRTGMRAYLSMVPDLDVAGEAADGQEALDVLHRLDLQDRLPDVVMMDLVMPRMDGIAATSVIRERYPSVEVVALTSFIEEDKVQAALQAGASGYLLKDAEADEVAMAIRSAHAGEVHIDPAVAKRLAESLRAPRQEGLIDPLTEREREILVLVAQGKANKQIARQLKISERTARTHVSNILRKLGLASRTQAALYAVREGLAGPADPPED
jgi:DNA-binding NarL/FixJ family response regulator